MAHKSKNETTPINNFTGWLACCRQEAVPPAQLVLPAETQVGAKTFGCLVNGKVWAANGGSGCVVCGWNPLARLDFDGLSIRARNAYEEEIEEIFWFQFHAKDFPGVGRYNLADTASKIKVTFYDWTRERIEWNNLKKSGNNYWEKGDTTFGSIDVKVYDEEKKIIAGTFEFSIIDNTDTLRVEQGRFDLGLVLP